MVFLLITSVFSNIDVKAFGVETLACDNMENCTDKMTALVSLDLTTGEGKLLSGKDFSVVLMDRNDNSGADDPDSLHGVYRSVVTAVEAVFKQVKVYAEEDQELTVDDIAYAFEDNHRLYDCEIE